MADVSRVLNSVETALSSPIIAGSAGVVVGSAVGGAVGYSIGRKTSKRRKKRASSSRKSKRKNSRTRNRGRNRYSPRTAGKRRDTSHRRIRQTKNGQPYIILSNGRARFISKKSALNSRKRKGGKY